MFYWGFKIRVNFQMPKRSRGILNSHEDFDTSIEHDDEYLKSFLLSVICRCVMVSVIKVIVWYC